MRQEVLKVEVVSQSDRFKVPQSSHFLPQDAVVRLDDVHLVQGNIATQIGLAQNLQTD